MSDSVTIRRLDPGEAVASVAALSAVLIDCVDGGASVGFMQPMTIEKASRYWQMVAGGVGRGERLLLVAEDGAGEIVGTVQLVLALPENQPHRADVTRLLVHPRARRRGIAELLMKSLESAARDAGKTLLVLDAVTGGDAARLYARTGWTRVGEIPNYALMPDGAYCDTTVFFKSIRPEPPRDSAADDGSADPRMVLRAGDTGRLM